MWGARNAPAATRRRGRVGLLCCLLLLATSVAAQEETLRFVEPEVGATFDSGTEIRVELTGKDLQEVMLVAPRFSGTSQGDGSGSFLFQYKIPVTADGALELTAFGRGEDDSFVNASTTINVAFDPARLKIRSLRVEPERLQMQVGETRRLRVWATLDDLTLMDITDARFGTKYQPSAEGSSGDEIAVVDADGLVHALHPGEITVTVRHPGAEQPATAQVAVIQAPAAEGEESPPGSSANERG